MVTPNTFLVKERYFTNFVLEFDIKMDAGLNSGVQIRSNSFEDYRNGRVHGPQFEVEDSRRGWAGGIFDEARKGWRYPLEYNQAAKTAFLRERWNTCRVVAYNNHIMTWINNVPVANLIEESREQSRTLPQWHQSSGI